MVAIAITWSQYTYGLVSDQYANNWPGHIVVPRMRRFVLMGNRPMMPNNYAGLYIIENAAGDVIYAGESGDVRARFESRCEGMQEFGILPAVAALGHVIRIGSTNPGNRRQMAERWLVRTLWIRDAGLLNRHLQNINLTQQYNVDPSGLAITNNINRPAYLNANYNYLGNAVH